MFNLLMLKVLESVIAHVLKPLNESILLAYNSTSQNINITAMFLYPHFHDSERGTKGHTFLFKAVR
jgi:hypothetical protein